MNVSAEFDEMLGDFTSGNFGIGVSMRKGRSF